MSSIFVKIFIRVYDLGPILSRLYIMQLFEEAVIISPFCH